MEASVRTSVARIEIRLAVETTVGAADTQAVVARGCSGRDGDGGGLTSAKSCTGTPISESGFISPSMPSVKTIGDVVYDKSTDVVVIRTMILMNIFIAKYTPFE